MKVHDVILCIFFGTCMSLVVHRVWMCCWSMNQLVNQQKKNQFIFQSVGRLHRSKDKVTSVSFLRSQLLSVRLLLRWLFFGLAYQLTPIFKLTLHLDLHYTPVKFHELHIRQTTGWQHLHTDNFYIRYTIHISMCQHTQTHKMKTLRLMQTRLVKKNNY